MSKRRAEGTVSKRDKISRELIREIFVGPLFSWFFAARSKRSREHAGPNTDLSRRNPLLLTSSLLLSLPPSLSRFL